MKLIPKMMGHRWNKYYQSSWMHDGTKKRESWLKWFSLVRWNQLRGPPSALSIRINVLPPSLPLSLPLPPSPSHFCGFKTKKTKAKSNLSPFQIMILISLFYLNLSYLDFFFWVSTIKHTCEDTNPAPYLFSFITWWLLHSLLVYI